MRKVAIANDIDKFQEEHGYTNTQIQQMMQDWLDGISMPDKDDHSGLELYQHLTEHRDGLEESGNSKDATREKIDRLIQDSLSGRQSRVHKNRFFGNLKEQINKKT